MRPLLALFVTLCLISVAFPNPLPEGDQSSTLSEGDQSSVDTEEPKQEEAEQTTEQPSEDATAGEEKQEEGGDNDKSKDAGDDKTADKGEDATKDKEDGGDGKGEEKNNPLETYNKVIELLDKTTKIDKVANSFLRSGLVSDLQTYLRNPIIDVIGRVGDYSKIENCFKSMSDDVKKILQEVLKSFQSCKDKKDSNEHHCSEDRSSSQGKIASISSTISSCVASKRS